MFRSWEVRGASLVLVCWFVAVACLPATAQQRSGSLTAGVIASTLTGDDSYDTRANLVASLAVRYSFGPLFAQTEAQLSTRGAAGRFPPPGGQPMFPPRRVSLSLTYLDVPLLVGLQAPISFRPYVYGGPYGGLRVDSQSRLLADEPPVSPSIPHEHVRRLDYGVMAGVGARVPTRFYTVVFDVRGMMGMADIYEPDAELRNRAIMVMAGIEL